MTGYGNTKKLEPEICRPLVWPRLVASSRQCVSIAAQWPVVNRYGPAFCDLEATTHHLPEEDQARDRFCRSQRDRA